MRGRLLCALVLALPGGAGCLDAGGNRITLQQWWQHRFGGKEAERSAAAEGGPAQEGAADRTEEGFPVQQAEQVGPRRDARSGTGTGPDAPAEGVVVPAAVPGGGGVPMPPAGAIRSDGLLVNNEVITAEDILEPIRPQIEALGRTLPREGYFREVRALVRQQLYDSVALRLIYRRARQTIHADLEPRIEKAVEAAERERINREFHGLETRYEQYLQDRKKTRAEVRERLRRVVVVDGYLRERLVPMIAPPRKRELMDYYEEHRGDFSKPERRELFLIDVPALAFLDLSAARSPEAEARAAEAAREAIETAAAELAAGRPFEDVARAHSKGPHAADGGAWGFISSPMAGAWRRPYARLLEMEPGEVSEILEVEHEVARGFVMKRFFIVKAGRVEGGSVISFKEAQPEIAAVLKNRRFEKLKRRFLERELERSTIGDLDAFLSVVLEAVPEPATMPGAGRGE